MKLDKIQIIYKDKEKNSVKAIYLNNNCVYELEEKLRGVMFKNSKTKVV